MCSLRDRRSSDTKEFTCEPLDKLKRNITDKQGMAKTVPALSAGFVKPRTFIVYKQPPPVIHYTYDSKDNEQVIGRTAAVEEWLERMEFIQEDLHWLLRLPYHRFWSQVIYYDGVHRCLESFLANSPRYYDLPILSFTEKMKESLLLVHKLVFMVYLRMSTYKESKCNHITPEFFGNMIYDNYLFDIPKIMDLCILYGNENHALLNKMINNIFSMQPSYLEDLTQIIPTVLSTLHIIQNKLGIDTIEKDEVLNPDGHSCSLNSIPWNELQDVINYLVDTCATLSAFLDIYPSGCHLFHQEGSATRIAVFYESVFPCLQNELKIRNSNENSILLTELMKRIALSKSCLLKVFRNIIVTCCIQPIIESSGISKSVSRDVPYLEDMLQTLTEAVSEKSFINAYQKLYPFEEDLDIISQTSYNIDPTRVDYILSGINSDEKMDKVAYTPLLAFIPDSGVTSHSFPSTACNSSSSFQVDALKFSNDYSSGENESKKCAVTSASETTKSDTIHIESLVFQVLDVLPDLHPSFAEACLKYYNYDFEKVINNFLEKSLPPSLSSLQHNLSRDEKKVESYNEEQANSVISERRNVFDNDEFDIFSQEAVDVSRIHKGKRDSTPKDYGKMEKDIEHQKVLKNVCERYGLTEIYVEDNAFLYEDEYDDTYDSAIVGLEEPPEEDEVTSIRPFTIPRVLEDKKSMEINDSDSSDECDNNLYQNCMEEKNKDHFLPNPADLREKAELRRKIAEGSKQINLHNVKGKPRGQGQSNGTLHNRRFKERHKDIHSNHSRKTQADKKRQKGMIPI